MSNDRIDNVRHAYPAAGRVILHVDMNAFFCSCHEAVEPHRYKGKPTAVSGSVELRRGIVVTCSYPAREYGVRTGMTVREALRLCPELVLIQPDFNLYRNFSRGFLRIASDFSPLVEATSIDECYIDITGSKQFGTPLEIAERLQGRIREELGLPCSIGVAPNKLLAKMASDMKKPNGLSVLRKRDVPRILWPKPCQQLFGLGAKTAAKLERLNIRTIGQLAAADLTLLTKEFGVYGHWLKEAANGRDDSPVVSSREPNKSIGHTTTLPADLTEAEDIRRVFLNLADQTGRRLRRQEMVAETIQIAIRDPQMKTITRSRTLDKPTERTDVIFAEAVRLFEKHWGYGKPVRLLGVTLQNLKPRSESAIQLDLFDYEREPRKEQLLRTMDRIRDKFGEDAVITAGMIGDDPSVLIRDYKRRGTSLQMDYLRSPENRQK
ncbi:DNA polymerase IV [Paenibacillus thermoaerophilus]|uniref:DNA polymerase IV n=1 Tax=Paenibacillus thermoaerophilus TaxID=1215385 RepID=A0ABW2V5G5_9BACL|nr:DNA polymerase IV [Paenibacillus thermoaerophilus]TMV17830.1 DNA polymerase IV [Paenibacillus thermoaerophilus]